MCRKSQSLEELIVFEIAADGPMTFARFMDRALYHPALGYYASGRAKIGRGGDFFTNVSVGPLFGKILAGQFEEIWRQLGKPRPFRLVEQGANDGQLAMDILSSLEGEFAAACEYGIVEPLENLRGQQEEKLRNRPVFWVPDLGTLPNFQGVHFSNELVDALPFHLVRSTGDAWEEVLVSAEEEKLVFASAPPCREVAPEVENLPSRPLGTLAELRPAATAWIQQLSAKLERGLVLVIDYGFPREKMLAPHRTEGTFSCYRGHKRDAVPLEDPGTKDITAHVDFTALACAAQKAGLALGGFTDQHHFLVGASENLLRTLDGKAPDPATTKTLRGLQTLLHPESMGTQFHYLAFSKNMECGSVLSGFRHARDPRKELFADSPGLPCS